VQVSLVPWRHLERGRLHFDETFGSEPAPQEGRNAGAGDQPGPPLAVTPEAPKGSCRELAQGTLRLQLERIEVNPDWPLALKSVWSLSWPPIYDSTTGDLSPGRNDASNSED
jgi:hypothetical protein